MTRLSHADYRRHLDADSARFRAVLADCDPAAPVPSCPDWDAADLLWHLGEVQHFWATMLRQRPVGPDDYAHIERPTTYDGLLAYFDEGTRLLAAELDAVGPDEEVWTWSSDHSVGFLHRRQAHEALIHRLDAELTAGTVTPLDPVLAADGVDEVLDVMYGGCPPWGTFTPSDLVVRVEMTDTGDRVWVQLGRFTGTDAEGTEHDLDDLHVVPDPGTEPALVVSGPAAALDAFFWKRGDDAEVATEGDADAREHFLRCLADSID